MSGVVTCGLVRLLSVNAETKICSNSLWAALTRTKRQKWKWYSQSVFWYCIVLLVLYSSLRSLSNWKHGFNRHELSNRWSLRNCENCSYFLVLSPLSSPCDMLPLISVPSNLFYNHDSCCKLFLPFGSLVTKTVTTTSCKTAIWNPSQCEDWRVWKGWQRWQRWCDVIAFAWQSGHWSDKSRG